MKIFEPLDLGFTKLPNRIVMGSMHTGLEESRSYKRLAYYYEMRAKGGVGLIISGGISPNWSGMVKPFGARMSFPWHVYKHREITQAVHRYDSKIVMQILHTGRYAYHPFSVAPSAIKAPINPFKPRALSHRGVMKTIDAFSRSAELAKKAGYDGVEVMGSEGYLINQFLAPRTNHRKDAWGGDPRKRMAFAIKIIEAMRERLGKNFLLIYRISLLDFVEDGLVFSEVIDLAKALEVAGVDIFNSGIGWHEARVPTIAGAVPHNAFAWASSALKQHIRIPIIAVNRINSAENAEQIVASGQADLVSMARPLLADPEFPNKAKRGAFSEINTCIACNQACLDNVFKNKIASCLVNPSTAREAEFKIIKAQSTKRIAVVGGGPAGMACAVLAAKRGHLVTLFEEKNELGGQFIYAARIPGKSDYQETIRYFSQQMQLHKVQVKLSCLASMNELGKNNFDEVVLACGVKPRRLNIPGMPHPKVLNYEELLYSRFSESVGHKVAIIGAGGIGFDVAEYLLHPPHAISTEDQRQEYFDAWGIDTSLLARGGLKKPKITQPLRKIYLLKRSDGAFGRSLGKTTGWIHRATLKMHDVTMWGGVEYLKVDDRGLLIRYQGEEKLLEVDHIISCAGQESRDDLFAQLKELGQNVNLIGGARFANELDAVRAIAEGEELALRL